MFDIKKLKVTYTPLNTLRIVRSENVRNEFSTDYNVDSLMHEMLELGQKTPILVIMRPDEKYHIVRGFRRSTALQQAADLGLHWQDGSGRKGLVTDVAVQVLPPDLSEGEVIELMVDQDKVRPLDIVGMTNAAVRLRAAGKTENEVIASLEDYFNAIYPPKKMITRPEPGADAEAWKQYRKDLFSNHRGTVQLMTDVWQAPTILRDHWYATLYRRPGVKLKRVDFQKLVKVYEQERDADPLKKIDRSNPGPKFVAQYRKLLEEQANAGEPKNKLPKLMDREDLAGLENRCESRIIRLAIAIVRRDIDSDKFGEFASVVAEFEKAAGDALSTRLDGVFGVDPTTAPATEATADTNNASGDQGDVTKGTPPAAE